MLLRHGESTYNALGLFTGLLDAPLTEHGRDEARSAARLLPAANITPVVVHSSLLARARETAEIVSAGLGLPHLPLHATWRLDERNYGALTGRSKAAVLAEYGPENFLKWRRTSAGEPPPMDEDLLNTIRAQDALRDAPPEAVTATESLDDVRARIEPFWNLRLREDVMRGRPALVVAHGNSLRALCAILDRLDEPEIIELNIPTGHPLVYEFDDRAEPLLRGGRYLDPDVAIDAARRVAEAGGT